MLVRVSVAVGSLLYNSLFVDLDMEHKGAQLSGQSSRLQISRSLVRFWLEVMVYVHDVVNQSDHSDDQHYEPNHNVNQNDYKKFS